MPRLRIARIIESWDMRKRHALRHKPSAKQLGQSEVLLAFNARQTIARFIDREGGVHDYYAAKGEMFDVASLTERVLGGLNVELVVGRSESAKADALRLVA